MRSETAGPYRFEEVSSLNSMRATFRVCATVILIALPLIPIFHLGPYLGLAKKERALSSVTLADGSKLVLTQKPNGNPLEPYSVFVYRVFPEGKVGKCLVGFKESYWWFAKLRMKSAAVVDIRADGQSVCSFNVDSWTLAWNEGYLPARRMDAPLYPDRSFLR
jgi:hypothetical protein